MKPPRGANSPIVCLGEAIVDLICEREAASPAEAECFRPHLGGALANVAVACRRAGAEAALAGGAGDDAFGRRLEHELGVEGVDLRWFELAPGAPTPVALVTFGRDAEPEFVLYGEGIEAAMRTVRGHVGDAIDAAAALVIGSNTLVSEAERKLTGEAREYALERGVPVLFDPNIRPGRWEHVEEGLELSRKLCAGSFAVRTNREESRAITGEDDPGAAAEALVELGAKLAVVTLGPDGALVRGAVSAEVPGVEVEVVSTLGAGDAFMGTLAAGLARLGWDPARAPEALPAAVEASAQACTRWGAWEPARRARRGPARRRPDVTGRGRAE